MLHMCIIYIYIYIYIHRERDIDRERDIAERSTIAPRLVCSLFRVVAGSEFCEAASGGCSYCCVLTGSGVDGGGAACWGGGLPVQVGGLTDAIGLTVSSGATNFLRANGGVTLWDGTLKDALAGDNDVVRTGEEAVVSDAVSVSGTNYRGTLCYVTSHSVLMCMGSGSYMGMLGIGGTTNEYACTNFGEVGCRRECVSYVSSFLEVQDHPMIHAHVMHHVL